MEEKATGDSSWKRLVLTKGPGERWTSYGAEEDDLEEAEVEKVDNKKRGRPGKPGRQTKRVRVATPDYFGSPDSPNSGAEADSPDLDMQVVEERENGRAKHQKAKRRRKRTGFKETVERRRTRLAKLSDYATKRLATESEQARQARLKKMANYAARKLNHESKAARNARLSRMQAYAAKRLKEETPEQRERRLAKMAEYAARRRAQN